MKTNKSNAPFGEIYSPPVLEVIETRVECGFAASPVTTGGTNTAPDFTLDTL